jgi:hypothetical protein
MITAWLAVAVLPLTVPPSSEPLSPPADDLAAVHAYCIGDWIFAQWEFLKDPVVIPNEREFWSELGDGEETPTEYGRRELLTDTLVPDEATVTIDGAYQEDEDGEYSTAVGLLYALLYECLAEGLAMPVRV